MHTYHNVGINHSSISFLIFLVAVRVIILGLTVAHFEAVSSRPIFYFWGYMTRAFSFPRIMRRALLIALRGIGQDVRPCSEICHTLFHRPQCWNCRRWISSIPLKLNFLTASLFHYANWNAIINVQLFCVFLKFKIFCLLQDMQAPIIRWEFLGIFWSSNRFLKNRYSRNGVPMISALISQLKIAVLMLEYSLIRTLCQRCNIWFFWFLAYLLLHLKIRCSYWDPTALPISSIRYAFYCCFQSERRYHRRSLSLHFIKTP